MSTQEIHHEVSAEDDLRVDAGGDPFQADIREQGKKDMDGGDHISVTAAPQNLATIAILVNFPSKTSNFTSRQRGGLGIVDP